MAEPIQTVTGSGIIDQAAAIADAAAKNALTARGQDVNAAIAAANNATQVAVANGNNATQLAVAQLQAFTAQDATNKQYAIDVQRLGLDRANLLRQQRMDQVNSLLGYNSQVLQAQGMRVDTKFRALELLASRSGPQDWVAYQYLLRQMGTPTGEAVDPTQWANEITMPERPDLAGMVGDVPPIDTTMPQSSASTFDPVKAAGTAATGATAPAIQTPQWPPPQPQATTQPQQPQNGYLGVPLADVKPGWNLLTTGSGGDFNPSDLDPSVKAFDANKNPVTGTLTANTPYWFQRAAQGMPYMRHPMVMTGDARGQNPEAGGARPEMVLNPTGAPIGVLSHEQTQAMMEQARQMPRYAEGTFEWDSPGGQMVSNGDNTMAQPMPLPDSMFANRQSWSGGGGGFFGPRDRRGQQPGGGGMFADWLARFTNPGGTGGGGEMVTMPIDPVTNPINVPATGTNASVGSTAQDYAADNVGTTNAPAGPDAQGTGGQYGMPDLPTYMRYGPEALANQPWIKSLYGKAAPEFQGFGATLSNPALGLENVPSTFSLQNYLALMPSERDMVQSLYEQGLGVDFRDTLERIRRATPTGGSYGMTYYGG